MKRVNYALDIAYEVQWHNGIKWISVGFSDEDEALGYFNRCLSQPQWNGKLRLVEIRTTVTKERE